MWAVTPNANWDNSRPYNVEDYEEGDPRFVRTEFNVLLKKSGNGWKATLEQDNELKTELPSISESEITTEEKNVLFGANKPENIFTEKNEVLIEGNSISSSSSTSVISSVSSPSVSTFSQSNSVSSSSISTSSTQSILTSSLSSKTIGLLDILFGSPRVSAGATDYSFPWTNGQIYGTSQGWHELQNTQNSNYSYNGPTGINVTGQAIDVVPVNGASSDVLAPVSGVIQRACVGDLQSHFKFEKMGILHVSNSGAYTSPSVTKSQKIGTIFDPNPYKNNLNYRVIDSFNNVAVQDGCGVTSGSHLHIKVLNGQVVDGYNFNYNNIMSNLWITSQNTPPIVAPQVYNNFSGGIRSTNYSNWVLDVKNYGILQSDGTFNQTPVQLINTSSALNNAQKWGYDSNTKR